jgi:1,2-beta-oligoglucan phosphorylase
VSALRSDAATGEQQALVGLPVSTRRPTVWTLRTVSDFGLTELLSKSGLLIQVTPGGSIFALRHGGTLINQLLPGPAEDGLFRLIVRWRAEDGSSGWSPIVGPAAAHRSRGPSSIEWTHVPAEGLWCRATLTVHPDRPAWAWKVHVSNASARRLTVDVLLAQDLGLGDEAAVRNSEAFASQYIDILPVWDRSLGWVLLARQNQSAGGNLHPWLALGCPSRASGFCTDGRQFFGGDHRLAGIPMAVRCRSLPSRRLQYECALAGLQSFASDLQPRASAEFEFVGHYLPDHPEASAPKDVDWLREVLPADWARGSAPTPAAESPRQGAIPPPGTSVFVGAGWLHGDPPQEADWTRWFPGPRRHEERDEDGVLLSFFHADDTHVVSRAKEATVARPHGHILRSGDWRWIDPEQFGLTCYASGIFSAQAYMGNPTFGRLLPVVRDPLGLGRSAGQRVFVRRSGEWHQLGVPSAFSMTPSDVRWIYRLGDDTLFARTWCSPAHPAAFLELWMDGAPAEFLVTHTLALGATEFVQSGEIRVVHDEGWARCTPDPSSMVGKNLPETCFAIAAADPSLGIEIGGDEMLFPDGRSLGHPCVVLSTPQVSRVGVILCGSAAGPLSLAAEVEGARREWRTGSPPSKPARSPVEVRIGADRGGGEIEEPEAGVARLNEILPWLAHNAAIHFTAPHGLEQYGGAAWGVRDVCQGSLEWLLAAGEWALVRRMLETVFGQQYARDGAWPQWFMHPPYRPVQHAHSHGDVCFWPVKALCDYLEASNDLGFFDWTTGYTDPETFVTTGPDESLLQHCDRVIGLCESRFVAGTALVNYGDGDWDDTLQPADPSMRTRMISSWTVGLAYHAFRQLAEVFGRAGHPSRRERLEVLLRRMRRDFSERLMPDGVVAGFLVTEPDGTARPLLHPSDRVTGIRYRLLPMTRSILAELFDREDALRHAAIVENELSYPDGARLMSEPAAYCGGREHLFKRADTAANVGREIGLMYVHAHLRYAEAMAKLGEAELLWKALQVVNPVGLKEVVPHALPRQSNVYFSSSDASFHDRVEAAQRWKELHTGGVEVRGGWRLYSSGPGLFIHAVRAHLLGVREWFGDVVFDPVLPRRLDGLAARTTLCGRPVELRYRVGRACFGPSAVSVNGVALAGGRRDSNPYRIGGLIFPQPALAAHFGAGENVIEIEL